MGNYIDFENPSDWYEFADTLYPHNPNSTRRFVRVHTTSLNNPYFLREILLQNYPKDTVFCVTNDIERNSKGLRFGDDSTFTGCTFQKVVHFFETMYDRGYRAIVLQDGMSLERVLRSNVILQNWADEINSAKFYGRPLSPLERYLYAYKKTTQFAYQKSYTNPTLHERMASIIESDGEHIVCLGYSGILAELCKKVGIPCAIQYFDSTENKEGHAIAMVYLKDERYDINGVYFADPCQDSRTKTSYARHTSAILKRQQTDNYCLNEKMTIVSPEQTFAFITSLPRKLIDSEFLTQNEEAELEDFNVNEDLYERLTSVSYNRDKVKLADMVVNSILYKHIDLDTLYKITANEFGENGPQL